MADQTANGRPGDHRETGHASARPREPTGSGLGGVPWALAGVAGVAALAVLGAQRLDPIVAATRVSEGQGRHFCSGVVA